MTIDSQNWATIHPSALRHAAEPLRRIATTLRPRGAIRYRCPVSGSYVLVTDAASVAELAERNLRQRCADCGEMHLLMQAAPAAAIVGNSTKP